MIWVEREMRVVEEDVAMAVATFVVKCRQAKSSPNQSDGCICIIVIYEWVSEWEIYFGIRDTLRARNRFSNFENKIVIAANCVLDKCDQKGDDHNREQFIKWIFWKPILSELLNSNNLWYTTPLLMVQPMNQKSYFHKFSYRHKNKIYFIDLPFISDWRQTFFQFFSLFIRVLSTAFMRCGN